MDFKYFSKKEQVYFILQPIYNKERMLLCKGNILSLFNEYTYQICLTEILNDFNTIIDILNIDQFFENLKTEKSFRTLFTNKDLLDINNKLFDLFEKDVFKYSFFIDIDNVFNCKNKAIVKLNLFIENYKKIYNDKLNFLNNYSIK